jgi:predicted HTH transcriptional regulator
MDRIRKALWDNLHNLKQISVNLLTEDNIQPVTIDGRQVLHVTVPRANRERKPVHVGSNPFGGTYLRRFEGDYLADDEAVRRMLAERVEDSRDERILTGFDHTDLDMDTVAAYRNRFAAVKPGHVWTDLPVSEFLERIGAFGKDREKGVSGLRLAGLVMFGRAEVIRDALPHYMVDYQERPEPKTENRWIDRLVPDGSWSGNIYDFFRKVYQKLTMDLKVPFQLRDGQRIEDTPVHEALREALVNTLIHADFSGRVSVLVVKRPDLFGFRNPGLMRIPLELAIRGGNSDCRNRRLQTMFQLVGYGDHAGSGLPKIFRNWAGQHWRRPLLYERREPDQSLMELRMTSLIPEDAVAELEAHIGPRFRELSELERMALITATVEGMVNHTRLREISTEHPADISKKLSILVRDSLLVSEGNGRGTVYFVPWHSQGRAEFADLQTTEPRILTTEPRILTTEPPSLTTEPRILTTEPPSLTTEPRNIPPVIWLDIHDLPSELLNKLSELALPVRNKQRVKASIMHHVVMRLCSGHFLSPRVLANLLNRDQKDLAKRILPTMVENNLLKRAYPNPHHPRQAYTTLPETPYHTDI